MRFKDAIAIRTHGENPQGRIIDPPYSLVQVMVKLSYIYKVSGKRDRFEEYFPLKEQSAIWVGPLEQVMLTDGKSYTVRRVLGFGGYIFPGDFKEWFTHGPLWVFRRYRVTQNTGVYYPKGSGLELEAAFHPGDHFYGKPAVIKSYSGNLWVVMLVKGKKGFTWLDGQVPDDSVSGLGEITQGSYLIPLSIGAALGIAATLIFKKN